MTRKELLSLASSIFSVQTFKLWAFMAKYDRNMGAKRGMVEMFGVRWRQAKDDEVSAQTENYAPFALGTQPWSWQRIWSSRQGCNMEKNCLCSFVLFPLWPTLLPIRLLQKVRPTYHLLEKFFFKMSEILITLSVDSESGPKLLLLQIFWPNILGETRNCKNENKGG